jgi:hypothetical protein
VNWYLHAGTPRTIICYKLVGDLLSVVGAEVSGVQEEVKGFHS